MWTWMMCCSVDSAEGVDCPQESFSMCLFVFVNEAQHKFVQGDVDSLTWERIAEAELFCGLIFL